LVVCWQRRREKGGGGYLHRKRKERKKTREGADRIGRRKKALKLDRSKGRRERGLEACETTLQTGKCCILTRKKGLKEK